MLSPIKKDISKLEAGQAKLEAKVDRLETKIDRILFQMLEAPGKRKVSSSATK